MEEEVTGGGLRVVGTGLGSTSVSESNRDEFTRAAGAGEACAHPPHKSGFRG